MTTLTLRTDPVQDEKIKELKTFLSVKTSSSAIIYAAINYCSLVDKNEHLAAELSKKNQELEELKSCIQEFKNSQMKLFQTI
ncbi:TPA: hypothetical protein SMT83_003451 [Proteus mirabilis]|uniref:hypothetical protein n=1 Tax=Proteus mirabilis TaxID=584 RepID=UPI00217DB0A6|nr:hypothetical protein [Proteus mirabilis]MCS6748146.1 hypothetical protein [Proteus mirabilis]HEK2843854.1 hypothetical protein [Proteus mirabilis]